MKEFKEIFSEAVKNDEKSVDEYTEELVECKQCDVAMVPNRHGICSACQVIELFERIS